LEIQADFEGLAGCRSLMEQYQFVRTALVPGFLGSTPESTAVLQENFELGVRGARKAAEMAVEIDETVVLRVERTHDLVAVAIGSVAEDTAPDAVLADHTEFAHMTAVAVGTDHTVVGRILAAATTSDIGSPPVGFVAAFAPAEDIVPVPAPTVRIVTAVAEALQPAHQTAVGEVVADVVAA
jgi:hypothetical protein